MRRAPVPLIALLLLVAGCTPAPDEPSAGPSAAPPTAPAPGSSPSAVVAPVDQEPTGEQEPAPAGSPYRVVSDWSVPSRPVAVGHVVDVPPLAFLAEVRFGDHPGEDPAYSRVTFAFDKAFPPYDIAYVRAVPAEGTGDPVALPGNAFLRITFRDARTVDDAGRTTRRPATAVGYPTLRGYGFGGDFEGHVTFGLGIQVAAGSDQVLPVRVGELVRPDGLHVVAVDVRR
jgi:hypothetical protein